MPMRRFSFPLVVHLSTLFGLLTIVTVVALTWLGYQRMVDLAEANGKELAEQSAAEVSKAVDIVFAPVELVTAMIGEHQVNEETTPRAEERRVGKASVSTCNAQGSPFTKKQKNTTSQL